MYAFNYYCVHNAGCGMLAFIYVMLRGVLCHYHITYVT